METSTETSTSITVDEIKNPVIVQTDEGTVLNVDEQKTETVFDTSQGTIHLVHEMTLGDVVISMFLMFILIFLILERFIRR